MNPQDIDLSKVRLFHTEKPLKDIPKRIHEICDPMASQIKPGSKIAIAVGSRGIANIDTIVKEVVDAVKRAGGTPFIIPAMGSHGGATAEGQRAILAGYGIIEEKMGAPVCSSMETTYLADAHCEPAFPVFLDRYAYESDGVIVINRVKPHTDFHSAHESGIVKMLVIGLGKQRQAEIMHRFGAAGLAELIPHAAQTILSSGKILCGIAILEDGFDNTSDIVFSSPNDFFAVDGELLKRSRLMIAKLPFENIDILIVDEIGKNISGSGMDTNVIGRMRIHGQEDSMPFCRLIVALDLTKASHGNAIGIGLSDITTQRLCKKINWDATNANVITSGFLQRGFLPVVAENDEEAIAIALNSESFDSSTLRLVRIKNTLVLDEIYVSYSLLEGLVQAGKGQIVEEHVPLSFSGGRINKF